MFDLWTHQFCLACDRQVQNEGAAYCSEACRLADFEKTSSTPSSEPVNSPASNHAAQAKPASTPSLSTSTRRKFYLSPAYDFSTAQPYGTTPVPQRNDYFMTNDRKSSSPSNTLSLTPSSSHSSLCSMQSNNSASSETSRLSEVARKELQAYAVSFEQVRLQRRRSY